MDKNQFSNKMVRWGILGCGDVCEVKSGPAFYNCQNSTLQAVMRRDATKAADFAYRHGVPRYYTLAEDLINDPEVDVVYVATPPDSHAELAIKVLQAQKSVYVEKPMGLTFLECEKMNQTARDNNQKIWVAYYRRSLPYFKKVKEIIDKGIIGRILTVRTEFFRPPLPCDLDVNQLPWRLNKKIAGGGYFLDMAPHTIDILMFILGKITHVNGVTSNTRGLYEVEDTVSASFLFEKGFVGSSIWCYVSPEMNQKDIIEIIGDSGLIRFSTFDFSPIELEIKSTTQEIDIPKPACVQQDMIQSIVDEILGYGESPSNGETGALTNWVIDQIFKANQ